MAFDLVVTLTGMHLLVPDPRDPDRLHALLPGTGGAHAHHHAGLIIGDAPELPLEGFALDLSAFRGARPGTVGPVGEVVNLSTHISDKLDEEQLGDHPRRSVVARVTLPPWDEAQPALGGTWRVDSGPVEPFTNRVTFTIRGVAGDALAWKLTGLRGAPTGGSGTARPVEGKVQIHVFHLPDKEPIINPGEKAPHFTPYYLLFKAPPSRQPVPVLVAPPPDSVQGGSFFTCLMAQALAL